MKVDAFGLARLVVVCWLMVSGAAAQDVDESAAFLARLEAETVDIEWAGQVEAELLSVLEGTPIAVEEVLCKTTLCKLRLRVEGTEEPAGQVLARVLLSSVTTHSLFRSPHMMYFEPGDGRVGTVFLAKPGLNLYGSSGTYFRVEQAAPGAP